MVCLSGKELGQPAALAFERAVLGVELQAGSQLHVESRFGKGANHLPGRSDDVVDGALAGLHAVHPATCSMHQPGK